MKELATRSLASTYFNQFVLLKTTLNPDSSELLIQNQTSKYQLESNLEKINSNTRVYVRSDWTRRRFEMFHRGSFKFALLLKSKLVSILRGISVAFGPFMPRSPHIVVDFSMN